MTWSSRISASSVASRSSCHNAASSVAVLRCGLKRRSVCALALKPYRASARNRLGGTSTVRWPTPTARIAAKPWKDSATSFAVNLRGPARSSSQRESCSPSGTSNSSSKRGPWCAVAASESDRYSRAAARSRAAVTARASTLAPGNNTLPSIRRAVARSNSTLGRSAVAHALASSHRSRSACAEASEKSRYPYSR